MPEPSTTAPDLTVVLVNHNGTGCLPEALDALERNTRGEVEIVVVDSASTDDSWRDVEERWPRARVLRFEENIGFAAGCNRGARAARSSLVAFVNFDGEVEPGWDVPLRALLEDSSVGVATGLLVTTDGKRLEAAGLDIAPNMATYVRRSGAPRSRAPDGPIDVTAAS